MARHAIVDTATTKVLNIIEWDGVAPFSPPAGTRLQVVGVQKCDLGYTYAGGVFAPGAAPARNYPAPITIPTGTVNARMGFATLVGGTKVVATTAITSNSCIFLTCNAPGGTPGFLRVSTRAVGASFTILSSSAVDASTVAWLIIEPA